MIIKLSESEQTKIVETEVVYFHYALPVDIPHSIAQLILAAISDLHLYCNQTKWKTTSTLSKTQRPMYGGISDLGKQNQTQPLWTV